MNATTNTLKQQLSGFHGTEGYHKLTLFGGFLCTDGVRHFAEEGKAFWAVDLIASYQGEPNVQNEGFQHWIITSKDGGFTAVCYDGNGKVLAEQEGEFTDLEEGEYHFYLTNKVLMLCSEY